MRDSWLYLQDIVEAMNSIETFVGDMNFDAFRADDKTASAVLLKLAIIGEAAKQIPADLQAQYPEVPWREMAGMRDRVVHAYFGVDYNLIWLAIKNRIPQVKPRIEQVLKDI